MTNTMGGKISNGQLIFFTGAGEVSALDQKSGEQLWVNKVGGMGNMSSPAIYKGKIYVGMSVPAFLFCLDAKTGKTLWKGQIPQAINTGMGDVSPALSDGIVVMDAISSSKTVNGKVTLMFRSGPSTVKPESPCGRTGWDAVPTRLPLRAVFP